MKNWLRYSLLFLSCCCFGITACKKRKYLNKYISLWRRDKIPYGTYYAYQNLPYIFPGAEITTSKDYPETYDLENVKDSCRALIILGKNFRPKAEDFHNLIRFAASGNQVFISAFNFSDSLWDFLGLKIKQESIPDRDSAQFSLLNPATGEWKKYSYPGFDFPSYFDSINTDRCTVLGKDVRGNPDFIRVNYDRGGGVYIHLNPMAFSNFFLLHSQNRTYYEIAFSYLAQKTKQVEWSDYFRYSGLENFSAFRFILGNPSLRWAFWLTILLFSIMAITEIKRKQRPVAEIPPPKNSSEDFVKTIGRLYFQQKNNANLASKMVAAFLENIRSRYNLPTSQLNKEFAFRLSVRSGHSLEDINKLVETIHESRMNPDFSDKQIMDLHLQINQLNKQA